jgi:hypothetical protein
VYTPTVTGTIISLENHARMHPRIHRWTQEAVPSSDQGWITFYDATDEVVSRYPTERINGLYYIQDLTFLPVCSDSTPTSINSMLHQADTPSPAPTLPMEIAPDDATVPIAHVERPSPSDFCHNFDVGLSIPSYIAAIQASTVLHPDPVAQQHRPVPHLSMTEKDIVHYHTWHQRLAHCSEEKLRHTQKLVDGLPPFSKSRLPHFVTCRACDIAKLRRGQVDIPSRTHRTSVLRKFFRWTSDFSVALQTFMRWSHVRPIHNPNSLRVVKVLCAIFLLLIVPRAKRGCFR